jgi:DNA-binding LytR/AlgR family response regulator
MIYIAIIEDNKEEMDKLKGYLNDYTKDNPNCFDFFHIDCYYNAEAFLSNCDKNYDIAFFDIELPNLDGMEAAMKFREKNDYTIIIFVTNMTQFVIKGYKVNALDYVIKPVNYKDIIIPLERALSQIRNKISLDLTIRNVNGISIVSSDKILFIEVLNHRLTYHTKQGVYTSSGSLTKLENQLRKVDFLRCNSCYLVNPKYISSVDKDHVILKDGSTLKISKPRKNKFMLELTSWLGRR